MKMHRTAIAAVMTMGAVCGSAMATPEYDGGTGIVSFGVANYGGGPVFGPPTYIPNNFTLLNDVLTSPAGGFQTANTSIINNTSSFGPGPLPGGGWQIGGGNGNGVFGAGAVNITGPEIHFALTDINPDGAGAAAYLIGSWEADYTEDGGYIGTYGNVLGIKGQLGSLSAAVAVSLRTHIDGAFWGAGFDLPELVLAVSGNGNTVAIGGTFADVYLNPFTLEFIALAYNTLPVILGDGSQFTVTSTLTAIGDPAYFSAEFGPNLTAPFVGLPDMPALSLSGTVAPEPSSLGLLAVAGVALLRRRR